MHFKILSDYPENVTNEGMSVRWHKSKGYSYFGNLIFVIFGMEEKRYIITLGSLTLSFFKLEFYYYCS